VAKPERIWPAVAIVVVVAIVAMLFLLGAVGKGNGSGGDTLGPVDPGTNGSNPDSTYPAAGPAPGQPSVSQPGQPNQGQPGQPGQPNPAGGPGGPGPTVASTTITTQPVLLPHMGVSFTRSGVTLVAYTVTVTVSNSGGASGTWRAVGVTLTGVKLRLSNVSSTVTNVLRGDTACFQPTSAIQTVAPSSAVTFTFTVVADVLGAVLGNVGGATLDSPACA
jgi:hypothetical protein